MFLMMMIKCDLCIEDFCDNYENNNYDNDSNNNNYVYLYTHIIHIHIKILMPI
jgi:hypothetical protein